jgi:hypothetical protein
MIGASPAGTSGQMLPRHGIDNIILARKGRDDALADQALPGISQSPWLG